MIIPKYSINPNISRSFISRKWQSPINYYNLYLVIVQMYLNASSLERFIRFAVNCLKIYCNYKHEFGSLNLVCWNIICILKIVWKLKSNNILRLTCHNNLHPRMTSLYIQIYNSMILKPNNRYEFFGSNVNIRISTMHQLMRFESGS